MDEDNPVDYLACCEDAAGRKHLAFCGCPEVRLTGRRRSKQAVMVGLSEFDFGSAAKLNFYRAYTASGTFENVISAYNHEHTIIQGQEKYTVNCAGEGAIKWNPDGTFTDIDRDMMFRDHVTIPPGLDNTADMQYFWNPSPQVGHIVSSNHATKSGTIGFATDGSVGSFPGDFFPMNLAITSKTSAGVVVAPKDIFDGDTRLQSTGGTIAVSLSDPDTEEDAENRAEENEAALNESADYSWIREERADDGDSFLIQETKFACDCTGLARGDWYRVILKLRRRTAKGPAVAGSGVATGDANYGPWEELEPLKAVFRAGKDRHIIGGTIDEFGVITPEGDLDADLYPRAFYQYEITSVQIERTLRQTPYSDF